MLRELVNNNLAKLSVIEGGLCPAFCCSAFHISQEDLELIRSDSKLIGDGPFIKDMLIPLSDSEVITRHEAMGKHEWLPEEGEEYFTCRHWDTLTMLCTVYENRPQMCRNYGETESCVHCGRCQ